LEVGVGTGHNLPIYASEFEVTGIDLTPGMLERAQQRADTLKVPVQLCLGDVQALNFPTDTFDSAVATFVFCSVWQNCAAS
jgi:ubiquinone/menaquinone biosynthesis C-methylase UbiE